MKGLAMTSPPAGPSSRALPGHSEHGPVIAGGSASKVE